MKCLWNCTWIQNEARYWWSFFQGRERLYCWYQGSEKYPVRGLVSHWLQGLKFMIKLLSFLGAHIHILLSEKVENGPSGRNQLPTAYGCTWRRPGQSAEVCFSLFKYFQHLEDFDKFCSWGNVKVNDFKDLKDVEKIIGPCAASPIPQLSWRLGQGASRK